MKLSREEAKQFFDLFIPLLSYVCEARRINVESLFTPSGLVERDTAMKAASILWADVSLIDDYLNSGSGFSPEAREILMGWKRAIHGQFILERHLTGGSIFISLKDGNVYLVKGTSDPFQEMRGLYQTPVWLTGTLLPFKGVIITDGLFAISTTPIAPDDCEILRRKYLAARRGGGIIKTL